MDLVAYLRVSTAHQAESYGLDAQRANIVEWSEVNGHRVVGWYQDPGISGTVEIIDRPGMTDALAALHPAPAKEDDPAQCGLVVSNLDRIARLLHLQESVLAVAWKAGGSVFTVAQGEVLADDPDDVYRTFIRQVMGGISQLERGLIAKRMRDGRKAKAAAGGKFTGRYPFGQAGEGKPGQRVTVVVKGEAAIAYRLIELRDAGLSYRQIGAVLDAEGLSPRIGDSWCATSVRNVALRSIEALGPPVDFESA